MKQDTKIGIVLIILAVIGFVHSLLGEFSGGAGISANLFPQMVFAMLAISGLIVILTAVKSDEPKASLKGVTWGSTMFFVLLGAGYFILVLLLGLLSGTFLYSLGIFALFFPPPRLKSWKYILFPALAATAFIWIAFTYLVEVLIPDPLLF